MINDSNALKYDAYIQHLKVEKLHTESYILSDAFKQLGHYSLNVAIHS